VLELIHFVSG